MISFTNCGQIFLFSILIFSVVSNSLLIENIEVGIASAIVSNTTLTGIPVYEITTRGNLFSAQGVDGSGKSKVKVEIFWFLQSSSISSDLSAPGYRR